MMHVYTSIDIGSDTIKIVVCELANNRLNLLAASSFKSKGIKKGLITDIQDATISLKNAFKNIEEMIGIKINKVIASVPSYFASETLVDGEIKLSSPDKIIDSNDVINVLKMSMNHANTNNQEIVTVLPIDFKVDDKDNILDPKGLKGNILKARGVLVSTPKKNIYSVVNILSSIGVEVIDISLNSICDIYCLKNSEHNKKVGSIINIGHDITEISIFNKGVLIKNEIVPLGGKNITNDISYMYETDTFVSNNIKEKFALAHKKYANVNDTYEVSKKDGTKIKINQLEISEIVMSRIEEILLNSKNKLNSLTKSKLEYIIITGGSSNMPYFDNVAKEIFGNIANVGSVRILGVRNNKYTSCIGNIIYFINKLKLKGQDYSMINENDSDFLSSVRKEFLNFSSDSTIGKLFGFFFGE